MSSIINLKKLISSMLREQIKYIKPHLKNPDKVKNLYDKMFKYNKKTDDFISISYREKNNSIHGYNDHISFEIKVIDDMIFISKSEYDPLNTISNALETNKMRLSQAVLRIDELFDNILNEN